MSLGSRLQKLEGEQGGSCGPGCPPVVVVRECPDRPRPDLAGCPRCGRAPTVVRVVRDRNFYVNSDRLPPTD
jgi:hypothetical protein